MCVYVFVMCVCVLCVCVPLSLPSTQRGEETTDVCVDVCMCVYLCLWVYICARARTHGTPTYALPTKKKTQQKRKGNNNKLSRKRDQLLQAHITGVVGGKKAACVRYSVTDFFATVTVWCVVCVCHTLCTACVYECINVRADMRVAPREQHKHRPEVGWEVTEEQTRMVHDTPA